MAVPLKRLFVAFAIAARRKQWLDVGVTVRSATKHRVVRLTWPDGSKVEAAFVDKAGRTTVTVTHSRLTSAAEAAERKVYWAGRFDALEALLAAPAD